MPVSIAPDSRIRLNVFALSTTVPGNTLLLRAKLAIKSMTYTVDEK